MKKKNEYVLTGGELGEINRIKFRTDIMREAREQNASVPDVLAQFFALEVFTTREMGRFALSTSLSGDLVDGTVVLLHALHVTAETAANVRVLEDYIWVSVTDPQIAGLSWAIDNAMNWPQGTVLPASRAWLAQI